MNDFATPIYSNRTLIDMVPLDGTLKELPVAKHVLIILQHCSPSSTKKPAINKCNRQGRQ